MGQLLRNDLSFSYIKDLLILREATDSSGFVTGLEDMKSIVSISHNHPAVPLLMPLLRTDPCKRFGINWYGAFLQCFS